MTLNTNPEHRTQVGTGHFMLTLCRLAAPVSIRPPQAPQLKPFTFFTSYERDPDGGESLYLHMGYFESLSDAERWVEAVHGRFPDASATVAPAALLRPPKSEVPSVQTADSRPADPQSSDFAAVEDNSLTDTRVMKILETRPLRSKWPCKSTRTSPPQPWCRSPSRRSRAPAKPACTALQSRTLRSHEATGRSSMAPRPQRRQNQNLWVG